MIQQQESAVQAEAPQASQTPQVSQAPQAPVGRSLRDLRVARGLSLEDVSARLKYSVRQIQALEDERWDQLPSGVSLRGMIRNYGRLLNVDIEPIVAALSGVAAVSARPTGLDLGASASVGSENPPRGSWAPWGWLLVIVAVLAVIAAYAFWRGWLPKELLSLDGIKQYFFR